MTSPKFEALQDRFISGTIDSSIWNTGSAGGSTASVNGGQLTLPVGLVTSGCGISSVGTFDLTSSEVTVELATPGDLTQPMQTIFGLSAAGTGGALSGNTLTFEAGFGTSDLIAWYGVWGVSGTTVASAPYSSVTNRFLRLKEMGGIVHWDVSQDGLAWTTFVTLALPFSVSAMYLSVSSYNNATRTTASSSVWGSVGYVPISSRSVSPDMGNVS